jgi:hypothetical protein
MPLDNACSVHLPYVIKRVEDGRYVVLNREYKPLGFRTPDRVDFRDYPIAATFEGLTAKVGAKLSHDRSDGLDEITLYSDACIPTESAANMIAYVKRIALLANVNRTAGGPLPLGNPGGVQLPYVIKRLEDGRYVVLNREYKPLGFQTTALVNYADYPIASAFKGLHAKVAAQLSHNGSEDLDEIALYDDDCIPTDSGENMVAYVRRIALLATLELA